MRRRDRAAAVARSGGGSGARTASRRACAHGNLLEGLRADERTGNVAGIFVVSQQPIADHQSLSLVLAHQPLEAVPVTRQHVCHPPGILQSRVVLLRGGGRVHPVVHRHGTTTRTGVTGDDAIEDDEPTDRAAPPPGAFRALRTTARLLLAGYSVLLVWLVLRPIAVDWTYPANLTPMASVDRALALGGYAGARQLADGFLPT